MASRIGLSYRNEAAEAKMRAAIGALAEARGAELTGLPEQPQRQRDSRLDATVQLEWMVEVLEQVAAGINSDSRDDLLRRIAELETELAERVVAKPRRAVKRDE